MKLLSNISCHDLDQNAFSGESNCPIESPEENKITVINFSNMVLFMLWQTLWYYTTLYNLCAHVYIHAHIYIPMLLISYEWTVSVIAKFTIRLADCWSVTCILDQNGTLDTPTCQVRFGA